MNMKNEKTENNPDLRYQQFLHNLSNIACKEDYLPMINSMSSEIKIAIYQSLEKNTVCDTQHIGVSLIILALSQVVSSFFQVTFEQKNIDNFLESFLVISKEMARVNGKVDSEGKGDK